MPFTLSPASAGSERFFLNVPGAHAPGFMLSPASQVECISSSNFRQDTSGSSSSSASSFGRTQMPGVQARRLRSKRLSFLAGAGAARSYGEDFYEREAGDETADVRSVSNAAACCPAVQPSLE